MSEITRNKCQKAKKLLTQYERLYEKITKKKMKASEVERLNEKRDAGTIRKSDLPGSLQKEFPGDFGNDTLEIRRACADIR